MRAAALYDIHGNLPALEAALGAARQAGAGLIVVGGDVIPGPMPGQTLRCLRDLDLPVQFIAGNGERETLCRFAGGASQDVPDSYREAVRWGDEQLTREDAALRAGWPATLRLKIDGLGEALFCHSTPLSDTDIFTRETPETALLPAMEGVDAALVVCGHTHMQFDRVVGAVRVVNAGSVGMPYGDPGAHWLRLGPDVRFQRTPYDLERAAEAILASRYPLAADFVARNVLRPPSEEEALEVLRRAEIR